MIKKFILLCFLFLQVKTAHCQELQNNSPYIQGGVSGTQYYLPHFKYGDDSGKNAVDLGNKDHFGAGFYLALGYPLPKHEKHIFEANGYYRFLHHKKHPNIPSGSTFAPIDTQDTLLLLGSTFEDTLKFGIQNGSFQFLWLMQYPYHTPLLGFCYNYLMNDYHLKLHIDKISLMKLKEKLESNFYGLMIGDRVFVPLYAGLYLTLDLSFAVFYSTYHLRAKQLSPFLSDILVTKKKEFCQEKLEGSLGFQYNFSRVKLKLECDCEHYFQMPTIKNPKTFDDKAISIKKGQGTFLTALLSAVFSF